MDKAILIMILISLLLITVTFKTRAIEDSEAAREERKRIILDEVRSLIMDVVEAVNQQMVDNWKDYSGKLDDDQKIAAKKQALDIINSVLTKETKELLSEAYGNLPAYLDMAVEMAVKKSKKS